MNKDKYNIMYLGLLGMMDGIMSERIRLNKLHIHDDDWDTQYAIVEEKRELLLDILNRYFDGYKLPYEREVLK